MTNLSDFLKVKKVKFVGASNSHLTNGKHYTILGVTDRTCIINDDNECRIWADMNYFEPVLADNSVNIQDTHKLKVGDKVYVGLTGKIARVTKIIDDDVVNVANKNNEVRAWISNICHATPENYERLQATFPDIEFEQPPKPLTGSDLARAMLDSGWKYVLCYISDSSDTHALERQTRTIAVITGTHKDHPSFFVYGSGKSFISHAVPFDPRTSEPLTESILND